MPLNWTLVLLWSQVLLARVTLALQTGVAGTWTAQAKVTRFFPSILTNDGNAAFDVEVGCPGCQAGQSSITLVLSGTATPNVTLPGSWAPDCSSATFRAAGSEALRRLPAGSYFARLLVAPSQQSLPFELHSDATSDGKNTSQIVETTEVILVQAPTARLQSPSLSINRSAALVTLTAYLDRAPLLPASLGLRLSDPTAADLMPPVLTWRSGETGTKQVTLRLNRPPAAGTASSTSRSDESALWAEAVPVSNVLLDTASTAARLDLDLPAPGFYVVTRQALYRGSGRNGGSSGSPSNNSGSSGGSGNSSKSGSNAALYSTRLGGLGAIGAAATAANGGSGAAVALLETFGVVVRRAGLSPFPSSLSYVTTVLETRGCRSVACDLAVSGSGRLTFTPDMDTATATLTVNWTAIPASATLRVGVTLTAETNGAVQTPLGKPTEVLLYGTQYGTCPVGTAGSWLGPAPIGSGGVAAEEEEEEGGLEDAAGGGAGSQMSTASWLGGSGGSGGACSEMALLQALASYIRSGSFSSSAGAAPLLSACSGGAPPVVIPPAGATPITDAATHASQTATTGLPNSQQSSRPSLSPPLLPAAANQSSSSAQQQPAAGSSQPPPSEAVTELHVPYKPQLAAVFVPLRSSSETVVVLQSSCSPAPTWGNVMLPAAAAAFFAAAVPSASVGTGGGTPASSQAALNTRQSNASSSGGSGDGADAGNLPSSTTIPLVWARWLLPPLAQPCTVQVGVYDTVIHNSAPPPSPQQQVRLPPLVTSRPLPPRPSPQQPPTALGSQSDPSNSTRGLTPPPAPTAASPPSPTSRSPTTRSLIGTTTSPSPSPKPPPPASAATKGSSSSSSSLLVYNLMQLRTHNLLLRPRGDPQVLSGRGLALVLQHRPTGSYLPLCGLPQPLLVAAAGAVGGGATGSAGTGSGSGRNGSSGSNTTTPMSTNGPVLAWAAATLARAIRGDPEAVQALRQQSQPPRPPSLPGLVVPRPSPVRQQVPGPGSSARPAAATPTGRRLAGLLGRLLLSAEDKERPQDGSPSNQGGAGRGTHHATPDLRRRSLGSANSTSSGGLAGTPVPPSPVKFITSSQLPSPPTVLDPTRSPAASTPSPSPAGPQLSSSPTTTSRPGSPRPGQTVGRGDASPAPPPPPLTVSSSLSPPPPAPAPVLPRPAASGIRAPEGFDLPLYPGSISGSSGSGGGGGTARVLFNREFMEWCDPGAPQAVDLALLPAAYDMTLQATSSGSGSGSSGGGGVVGGGGGIVLGQVGGATVLGQGTRTALAQRREEEENEDENEDGSPPMGPPSSPSPGVALAPPSPAPADPDLPSSPEGAPPDSESSLLPPDGSNAAGTSNSSSLMTSLQRAVVVDENGDVDEEEGGELEAVPPPLWMGGEAPIHEGSNTTADGDNKRGNSSDNSNSAFDLETPPDRTTMFGSNSSSSGDSDSNGNSSSSRDDSDDSGSGNNSSSNSDDGDDSSGNSSSSPGWSPSVRALSASPSSPAALEASPTGVEAAGEDSGACGAGAGAADGGASGGGSVLPSADERLVVTLVAPDGITTTSLALNLYVDYGKAAAEAVEAEAEAAAKCQERLSLELPASSSSSNIRALSSPADSETTDNSSTTSGNSDTNTSNHSTPSGGSNPSSPTTASSSGAPSRMPPGAGGGAATLRAPPPSLPPAPPDACRVCGPGSYSASPNASTCQLCAPGSYSGGAINGECTSCPAGMYAFAWGSTMCRLCVAGSYAPRPASTACSVCPSGTTSLTPGARECTASALPPTPDPGSRVVVVVTFGLLLNLSNPGSVSELTANTTGIDASPDSIVKLLVAADTADALRISPSQVRVSLFEISPSAFLVNVSATVPMGGSGSGGAYGGEGTDAAMDAVDADTLIGRLVRNPEDSFPRTKDTTGGSLQVQYVDRQVVTLDASGGSFNVHVVLWPTLAGTLLMALALGLACKRYCGRRRGRLGGAALPPLSDAWDRLCPWRPSSSPPAILVYGSLASLELQELSQASPAAAARHRGRGGSKVGLSSMGLSMGLEAVSGATSSGGGNTYGPTDMDVLKFLYTRDALTSQHI